MKQIVPEIYIRDCSAALQFYQSLFGGEIKNLQLSDDLEMFKDTPGRVIHAELHVNTKCIFYFVDSFEEKHRHPGNVTLVLHMHTRQEIQQAFDALAQGGSVGMDLQKTFWGEYHAIVTDRFGAPWALNYKPRRRSGDTVQLGGSTDPV